MNIIPFNELPPESIVIHDGIGTVTPSGSQVEVYRVEGDDRLRVRLCRKLDEENTSELTFTISSEAAMALSFIIQDRLGITDLKAVSEGVES